jgi:hypothetical protein
MKYSMLTMYGNARSGTGPTVAVGVMIAWRWAKPQGARRGKGIVRKEGINRREKIEERTKWKGEVHVQTVAWKTIFRREYIVGM